MKRYICLIGIVTIVFLVVQSCTNNNSAKKTSKKASIDSTGQKFIQNALDGSITEIKASELVAAHSKNVRVINLAKLIIEDHNQVNVSLKKIEKDNAIKSTDTIATVHTQAISELTKLSGEEFDRSYLRMMIRDHESALMIFLFSTQNSNQAVQAFAKKTLPTIQLHLDSARAINKALK
ncbi:MAG: DUF4142 domain-containing protein [Mucilaginibacter sp.]